MPDSLRIKLRCKLISLRWTSNINRFVFPNTTSVSFLSQVPKYLIHRNTTYTTIFDTLSLKSTAQFLYCRWYRCLMRDTPLSDYIFWNCLDEVNLDAQIPASFSLFYRLHIRSQTGSDSTLLLRLLSFFILEQFLFSFAYSCKRSASTTSSIIHPATIQNRMLFCRMHLLNFAQIRLFLFFFF